MVICHKLLINNDKYGIDKSVIYGIDNKYDDNINYLPSNLRAISIYIPLNLNMIILPHNIRFIRINNIDNKYDKLPFNLSMITIFIDEFNNLNFEKLYNISPKLKIIYFDGRNLHKINDIKYFKSIISVLLMLSQITHIFTSSTLVIKINKLFRHNYNNYVNVFNYIIDKMQCYSNEYEVQLALIMSDY